VFVYLFIFQLLLKLHVGAAVFLFPSAFSRLEVVVVVEKENR
jgi:hypothetical protein